MPTKRTWRDRQAVEYPSAYQAHELLTGEISYPVLGYDGYGDGTGTDLTEFIDNDMRADWAAYRAFLMAFWISGQSSYDLPNTKPWLCSDGAPGTRPWAWWQLEPHPPRHDGESEPDYLDRTRQWLPNERGGSRDMDNAA